MRAYSVLSFALLLGAAALRLASAAEGADPREPTLRQFGDIALGMTVRSFLDVMPAARCGQDGDQLKCEVTDRAGDVQATFSANFVRGELVDLLITAAYRETEGSLRHMVEEVSRRYGPADQDSEITSLPELPHTPPGTARLRALRWLTDSTWILLELRRETAGPSPQVHLVLWLIDHPAARQWLRGEDKPQDGPRGDRDPGVRMGQRGVALRFADAMPTDSPPRLP